MVAPHRKKLVTSEWVRPPGKKVADREEERNKLIESGELIVDTRYEYNPFAFEVDNAHRRPNPSGSFLFPGMQDLSTRTESLKNQQALLWHAAIDIVWKALFPREQDLVRRYCALWSPMAKPTNPSEGSQEALRAKFWRDGCVVPKCHTCSHIQSAMPGMISSIKVDNLCKPMECPIGLNAEPLLPCGCREDLAFFEMWAVARGVWTETRLVNSKTVPQAMSIPIRYHLYCMFNVALGRDKDAPITWELLVDRTKRLEEINDNTDMSRDDQDNYTELPKFN